MSEKRLEANRRNALRSSGPKTEQGVQGCKNNALRHGLRALQTVVPGEEPAEWEAHRAAVVADLDPQGAVELALAEQVAEKLWRLGRVVRHEADLITNAQDEDEVLRAHELAYTRIGGSRKVRRTDIPTRADVEAAKGEAEKAEEKLADRDEALRQLEGLATMKDEDAFEGWNPLYEALQQALRLEDKDLERLFRGGDEDGPLLARHAREMLAQRGAVEEITALVVGYWRADRAKDEDAARKVGRKLKALHRRYESALERRRRAHGLPAQADLDRIQRYEAHLERGLHKALDRLRDLQAARGLRDLQAARGAVPPRGPSVAVAVVQAGPEKPLTGPMGPFGSFALEAVDQVQGPAGVDSNDGPDR
jgi:hypothetical protein